MAEHETETGKIGMWLFLFTEILLFGALFIAYAVYLYQHTHAFSVCSRELELPLGATNTVVLLTSSLTVALAISSFVRGRRAPAIALLGATLALAAAFLTIKYFEWGHKFAHDIYPGSPLFDDRPPGDSVFFGLYFVMTGFHALHVAIGSGAIAVAAVLLLRGARVRPVALENVGLYWHLVDIVWIFLFPLFYLIG